MRAIRNGSEPVRGNRLDDGDATATVGVDGARTRLVGDAPGWAGRVELDDGAGTGTALTGGVRTVVEVRGTAVVVVVDTGAHHAGRVVLLPGTVVVGSESHGEVVDVVVEVVGATVVVERGVVEVLVDEVVDEVGATVVVLDGGAVVEVVGAVVVVVTTEYEYATHTVAEASTMIRFTWLPLPKPWVRPTALNVESNVPGPTNGSTSVPLRVNGGSSSLVSTGPVSKPDPA
jgi:hypothetical protein